MCARKVSRTNIVHAISGRQSGSGRDTKEGRDEEQSEFHVGCGIEWAPLAFIRCGDETEGTSVLLSRTASVVEGQVDLKNFPKFRELPLLYSLLVLPLAGLEGICSLRLCNSQQ